MLRMVVVLLLASACESKKSKASRASEEDDLDVPVELKPQIGSDGFLPQSREALRRAQHEIKEGNVATMETCDMLKAARALQPKEKSLEAAHIQLLLKVGNQQMAESPADMEGFAKAQEMMSKVKMGKNGIEEEEEDDDDDEPDPPPPPPRKRKERKATSSAALRAILNVKPTDASGYFDLGEAVDREERKAGLTKEIVDAIGTDDDGAAAAYKTALSLEPDSVDVLQALSIRLSQSKSKASKSAALKHAKLAVNLAPELAMSYVALGMSLGGGRRPDAQKTVKAKSRKAAIKALQSGLSVSQAAVVKAEKLPKHIEAAANYGLGSLYLHGPGNREDEATKCFARAVKLQPDHKLYKKSHEIMQAESPEEGEDDDEKDDEVQDLISEELD